MFGFLIKKAFFDLWDNFLPAILVNLGFIVILAVPVLLPSVVLPIHGIIGVAAFVAGALLVFLYLGGVSTFARLTSDYTGVDWKSFRRGVAEQWPVTLLFGALVLGHLFLISVAVPVYSSMGSMVGLFALAVLFWISVIWWLTCQFILPVRSRLSNRPVTVLRKSLLLVLDNVFFAVAVAAGGVFIVALSIFTAFLIPGISGLMIWFHDAAKLRLYKYDYLEQHHQGEPGAARIRIPWDTLLYDDRERVGKRTLRGMIFPWKE